MAERESARTEFSNSNEEDKTYAKMFWQSLQLLPPMESSLEPGNVKQRLKVAPPGHQTKFVAYEPIRPDSPELVNFWEHARALDKVQELKRLEKFSALRDADIALLHKHRQERKQKEKISNHRGLVKVKKTGDPFQETSDGEDAYESPQDTIKAIRAFEEKLGYKEGDSDSD